jgi:hypothetical protein
MDNLSVHEHTSHFAGHDINDDADGVEGEAPCPASMRSTH